MCNVTLNIYDEFENAIFFILADGKVEITIKNKLFEQGVSLFERLIN